MGLTPSVTYGYDANGNMTTKTVNGSARTTYTYNYDDQLAQITFRGTPTKWLKFYYDGLGRRIKSEYYDGASTTTRQYVYLGGWVIRELDNSPTPTCSRNTPGGLT
jgi:YD repeat-containing protein